MQLWNAEPWTKIWLRYSTDLYCFYRFSFKYLEDYLYLCCLLIHLGKLLRFFISFLLKHMTIVFIFDICTMSFTNFYFSVLESTTQCWFFSPSILSWWPHYITSLVMPNYIGKKVVLWTSVFSITCWAMDWPIFISTIGSEWIHYWLKIENHYNMWQPWFDKVVSIWYWLWKMWFYCG